MKDRVLIRKLSTGVPGLDEILGGGLPELSFNLIAGGPGCGKTTLAHQFLFANASPERKAIYFTVFGEPPIKMLRYQQQFTFFDPSKIADQIRFVHLGRDMIEGGLARVLERITEQIEAFDASIVVVDSFRSVARGAEERKGDLNLERFVQLLALTLTSYEATTFLVGEYQEQETLSNPIFTLADGLLWLYQNVTRNSVVRRMQVVKMRGQAQIPGLHTLKISEAGVRAFPRLPKPEELVRPTSEIAQRQKTGVTGLDEMLGGGIPAGYSIMVAGPTGSGKTMLSMQFLLEGVARGEPGVIVVFEKRPEHYLRTSPHAGELERYVREGMIKVIYIRPLDLSVDETLVEVQEQTKSLGARRVVIDSLSGFELALAPAFREDFRESLYRMLGAITNLGVTVVMTVEVGDSFTDLRLSSHGISFLSDGIVWQRYIELDGKLQKMMTVVKLRASQHSKEMRRYEVTAEGIVVGPALEGYRRILTGMPVRAARQSLPGDVRQSLPGDVRQSLPGDVRQSLPGDVRQSLPRTGGSSKRKASRKRGQ